MGLPQGRDRSPPTDSLFIGYWQTKVGLLPPSIPPVLGVLHTYLTALATVGLFIDIYQPGKCFCFLNKLRLYRHISDRKWKISRRPKKGMAT